MKLQVTYIPKFNLDALNQLVLMAFLRPTRTLILCHHSVLSSTPRAGTAYQPIAKYLTRLLNPLTQNAYTLKDSFEAVSRIQNIPINLFKDGYRFVSFDVKSLFTNVPLKKTINIILDKIYNKKEISTSVKKRTLKKLLLDSCTKTPFSMNGELYKQIDGVAMGSPLGPTLANIIMTTFEEEIIRKWIDSNLIKFYARYVDDTLVLAKPLDVPKVLEAFNSFHPQIQFTFEEFPDNIVHFLDLQINSSDITIYRKPTHRHWSIYALLELHPVVS